MEIWRCYVEKRGGFDIEAKAVEKELKEVLKLEGVSVRIFNRYDVQNSPSGQNQIIINTVLSEPMADICFSENLPKLDGHLLCIEPLPGQFDARADSAQQCVQMLLGGERPIIKSGKVFEVKGVSEEDFADIKTYLINPLEYRETSLEKPTSFVGTQALGDDFIIEVISDFITMDKNLLNSLLSKFELAMSFEDLSLIQEYFVKENRNPTITELRAFDTYWSDHCRHTTFGTVIENVEIKDNRVKAAYELFLSINGEKSVTLMNMATAAMRQLRKIGALPMLDVSEENNACTIKIKAEFEDKTEDWLLYFKNETHNHPTEIEPFGGASTCIGGAIRDPLSGRAYVYHAMRITGAADPRTPIDKTIPGKLPQRKLTQTAAQGFSSYGNQIGLATGFVKEFYHEGYVAKRLETGAVVGAAPQSWVRREEPTDGDVIVLMGGRTGRDGIGGATGSSKSHGTETVSECALEVQKGNAPEERKLQRLFRNPEVTKLIKRCNDFGAGGVSVAVGELADGVEINLDAVPTKYEGLNGTELAISESQERMAIVVESKDVEKILKLAKNENIEASIIAKVTKEKRLVMKWRNQKIVDISREFLNTNGASRTASASVSEKEIFDDEFVSGADLKEKFFNLCGDLNFCSQKGLVERFDASIGTGSVLVPFGGKTALTESQVMAALIPAKDALTASVMASGFDPCYTKKDPFAGAVYAVVSSVAKLIASGVNLKTIHLSLQEFFPRLKEDPKRWGQPFAAMLGALSAQMGLKVAAIGGKDSMSGSFGELDVPPTMISFAVGVTLASRVLSPEFKKADSYVYLLETPMTEEGLPNYDALKEAWDCYYALVSDGKVLSSWACEAGGVYGGIMKMCFGNMIGFEGEAEDDMFSRKWGSIIFESEYKLDGYRLLGKTNASGELTIFTSEDKVKISLKELSIVWKKPLESVFPTEVEHSDNRQIIESGKKPIFSCKFKTLRPKAIIPVFPGTNCEYDTIAAIERAGGVAETVLIRNLEPAMLKESIRNLEKAITSASMIVFPGGFSGGDEPDGSAKFIVSLFKNQVLTDSVHNLLENRDGLILGICNGFQALVKLGLLPYGKISQMTENCPTLTHNSINRHQAMYVNTRVASVNSPWLSKCKVGEVYAQPISHGEGRFAANSETLATLKENGQIVFQYLDNPNGSVWDIEGICSPDGRVLGKMAHTERSGKWISKNIPGDKFMPLFESGVDYFK